MNLTQITSASTVQLADLDGLCAKRTAPDGAAGPGSCGLRTSALPPFCNTGGKFSPSELNQTVNQNVKIDWLNATFNGPTEQTQEQFIRLLGRVIGRELTGVTNHGTLGFEKSVKLFVRVGSDDYSIGTLAWGGDSQKGRWMLQITGAGCRVVTSWSRLRKLLAKLEARITRVDLALDFLEGEYSVNDAVAMYQNGNFNAGGRAPSTSVAGDWIGGVNGRTLYVGKATNGKMLRVYEKGIQLGNLASPWVRFEVQLGNRDRVIPLDVLTERASFMAGCYPALAAMLSCAACQIETSKKEGAASLAHLMFHLVRSYGKLIGTVIQNLDCDAMELVESVSVRGVPRRMKPDAVTSGLTWEQLLPQFKGEK